VTRRRKFVYPPAKTAGKGSSAVAADARAAANANRAVTINLQAMTGRSDIRQGARVRIASGTYEGELAVVESVVGGVIPAVVVRTLSGQARRVRSVDLIPEGAAGFATGDERTGPTQPGDPA
jgi:hypothetical protein